MGLTLPERRVLSFTWEKILESLPQRLRILILMPQIINGKAIVTFCEILKRQIVLLKNINYSCPFWFSS
uniref:Uncharacterized protein n=1 Tax=Equus caballus TaxID=9796 RepID=A0A9L0TNX6_HORSE